MQDDCQFQIVFIINFFMIFGVLMNILFIIKVKILKLTKWLYESLDYVDS